MRRKHLVGAATLVALLVAAGVATLTATAGDSSLDAARAATAKFQNVSETGGAGYGLFKDVNGIACIAMPGMGAMGYHYVNGNLVGDPGVSPTRPEALVYERKNGQFSLVALEYITIKSAWDARHSGPPKLFGQTFNLTLSPNRYGLPDFYSLHAWIWKANPAGTFAPWNPDVRC
jgi:hypothetical protein